MINLFKMSKEHEKLFPNATLESQIWKLEEEISEFENAEDEYEEIKESADIVIVCAGLYRWCPKVALSVKDFYLDSPLIEEEVNRKWQINLKRKWEWNGKTYHHVEDGNE